MGMPVGRIREVLAGFPIPDPWDRHAFVHTVATLRGRPVTVIPLSDAEMLDGPCGLWLMRECDDVIIHNAATSPYHADQIVCHEIGHIVLGHDRIGRSASDADDPMLRSMLPDLDPSTVRAILGRSAYDSGMEREAEIFATMVITRAHRQRRPIDVFWDR